MRWLSRIGIGTALTLACGSGSVQPAVASGAGDIASQVTAVARTDDASAAKGLLEGANDDLAIAELSKDLLRQYSGSLTSFQKDLLKINLLVARPRNRALLSSLKAGRRISSGQAKRLGQLLSRIADNPAIQLVNKQGRRLQKHPAKLSSYIATLNRAAATDPSPLPSPTQQTPLAKIGTSITQAWASDRLRSFANRMGKIFAEPGAEKYVASLPPLVVASFAPSKRLTGSQVAKSSAARSPREEAEVAIATDLGLDAAEHTALLGLEKLANLNLPPGGWQTIRNEALAAMGVFKTLKIRGVSFKALITGLGIILILNSGRKLYLSFRDLYETLRPDHLFLSPLQSSAEVGEEKRYTVEGYMDDLGIMFDVSQDAGLTISPDGSCKSVPLSCTAIAPGDHTVTAYLGEATTTAHLNVTSGLLKISPDRLAKGIPGVYYRQDLDATDPKGNVPDQPLIWSTVAPLPPGLSLNSATGVIEGAPQALGDSTVSVEVHDQRGDKGAVEFSLSVEPPQCSGSPCAIAAGHLEVTVVWNACGCVPPSGFHGVDGYYLGPYVNGVAGGGYGEPFVLGPLRVGAPDGSAGIPVFAGPGGRLWYTYPHFDGSGAFGQVFPDSMFFDLYYGTKKDVTEETVLLPLGQSNSVVVF